MLNSVTNDIIIEEERMDIVPCFNCLQEAYRKLINSV